MSVFTAFDIETTGLRPSCDDILSFAAIDYDEKFNIIGGTQVYFYYPDYEFDPGAVAINGLSREVMEGKNINNNVSLSKMYSKMHHAIAVSKNGVQFDWPFIEQFVLKRARSLCDVQLDGHIDMQIKCAPIFQKYSGTRRKGKLSEYIPMFGLDMEELKKEFLTINWGDADAESLLHTAAFDTFLTFVCHRAYVEGGYTE